MKKIIYSKCATERKKEFRIITSIVENDDKRLVYKRPLDKQSEEHVKHMYEVYSKDKFKNSIVKLVPCKKDDDAVVFEFIEGDTLSTKFEEAVQKEDWEKLLQLVAKIQEIIYSADEKKTFQSSEEFEKYFGSEKELDKYEAAKYMNIDLLPENIIVKDREFYVIDYEWIFSFAIPIKYVMFRALFFLPCLRKIPMSIREEVLKLAEISVEEWNMFYKMEIHFQSRVSDSSLDELYKKMPQNVFFTNNQNIGMQALNIIKAEDEQGNELYHAFSKERTEHISLRTKKDGVVRIELTKSASIIKILELKINGVICSEFKTNCALQIIDDYYFVEDAILEVNAMEQSEISVEYMFMDNPKNELATLATSLKTNNELTLKNMELVSEIEILKKELTCIKNAKGWNLYSKINNLN